MGRLPAQLRANHRQKVKPEKLAVIVLLPFAAFSQACEAATVKISAPGSTSSHFVDDPPVSSSAIPA
jgi:hypothetical protein